MSAQAENSGCSEPDYSLSHQNQSPLKIPKVEGHALAAPQLPTPFGAAGAAGGSAGPMTNAELVDDGPDTGEGAAGSSWTNDKHRIGR